jgi:hypothetical protein
MTFKELINRCKFKEIAPNIVKIIPEHEDLLPYLIAFTKHESEIKFDNPKSFIKFVELSNRNELRKNYVFYEEKIEEIQFDLRTALIPYLPEDALEEVVAMLQKYSVILQIETPRKERRGAYENKFGQHKIYINNDLDKYTFFAVFLHEYAHLLAEIYFSRPGHHLCEFDFCIQKLNFKFTKIIPKNGIDIYLHKTKEGIQFKCEEYESEVFVRNKGRQGKIPCTKLSDNTIIQFERNTIVEPILDLRW